MRFAAAITRQCNLRCRYCYVSHDSRQMDAATARQAVDLAISQLRQGELLDFGFFGGEPLLNFPRLRQIAQYLRAKQSELGFDLVMRLTSNGTVLTPEALEFMTQEQMRMCVSLDGPEDVYYQQRGDGRSNGIFETVVANLHRAAAALPSVHVNAVYGPATLQRLPSTVRFLAGFGLPIDLNIDIMTDWTADSLKDVDSIFSEVGQLYLDRFRRNEPFELHPVEDSLVAVLFGGCSPENRCKLGVGELAVDVTGKLYPCERLLDHEQTIIGDVDRGINEETRNQVVRQHGQPHPACADCPLKRYCNHSCGCTNWFMTGDFGRAHHVVCRVEKAWHGLLQELLEPLNATQSFHDYMGSVVLKGCGHCRTQG